MKRPFIRLTRAFKISQTDLFASHEISDETASKYGQSLAVEIGRVVTSHLEKLRQASVGQTGLEENGRIFRILLHQTMEKLRCQ